MYDGVAKNKHVRLVVGKRSKSLVVLLTGRVQQLKRAWPAVDVHGCGESIEHGGNVVGGEFVFGIGVDHARFSDRAVSDEHRLHAHQTLILPVVGAGHRDRRRVAGVSFRCGWSLHVARGSGGLSGREGQVR